mmetsp:Transcript_2382/g.9132  ORF Transcript_2382/g.9132 Transcript_2382/m.9132 type:complete len:247 (-) Transcript_2382:24-764(-)
MPCRISGPASIAVGVAVDRAEEAVEDPVVDLQVGLLPGRGRVQLAELLVLGLGRAAPQRELVERGLEGPKRDDLARRLFVRRELVLLARLDVAAEARVVELDLLLVDERRVQSEQVDDVGVLLGVEQEALQLQQHDLLDLGLPRGQHLEDVDREISRNGPMSFSTHRSYGTTAHRSSYSKNTQKPWKNEDFLMAFAMATSSSISSSSSSSAQISVTSMLRRRRRSSCRRYSTTRARPDPPCSPHTR